MPDWIIASDLLDRPMLLQIVRLSDDDPPRPTARSLRMESDCLIVQFGVTSTLPDCPIGVRDPGRSPIGWQSPIGPIAAFCRSEPHFHTAC